MSRRTAHSINQLGMEYASTKETLEVYIQRACDPGLMEPNLSLDLDIAEYVNLKKANTPREAAVEVLRHANSRNNHVAMLALTLLDILVKNCGYAFHLQISTKEFLNELVRRFPERPPVFPPPPMLKVLALIQEWKTTLCVHSKHREDLVHIRDMHRLLGYKGYRFPDVDRRSAAALAPGGGLQSPDELEAADREDQAAKLQELIRRGTPRDLEAAQALMKVMAGAEPDAAPDYAQQVARELDRVQQRVLLLNEMLTNAAPDERFVDGDAFDQIAAKCTHAQPKLQRWIEESYEQESTADVDRLLMMNDLINSVLARYAAFKRGDRSATAEIPAGLSSAAQGAAQGAARSKDARDAAPQAISLIDFDDAPAAGSAAEPSDPLADLAGLSLSSAPPPAAPLAAPLQFSQPATPASSTPQPSQTASLLDFDTIAPAPAPALTPVQAPAKPNYNISLSPSGSATPAAPRANATLDDLFGLPAAAPAAKPAATKSDPFADLLDL